MPLKERIKRYTLCILCLFFMGIGVALTRRGEMGVSPISSVSNVISLRFTAISFGMWLAIVNCFLILGQILLLRKRFQPFQLLQLPLSLIFGYFTDFGVWLVHGIPNELYPVRLLLVLSGILVLGFSITLGIAADVILNAGEAFVKVLADVLKKDFGMTKVVFDISWVAFSVVLSLIFFNGNLVGVREGTVISAILVGFSVKLFSALLLKPLTNFIKK